MRKVVILYFAVLFPVWAYAQTVEELEAEIRHVHECFFNLRSQKQLCNESYTLSSGKVVHAMARNDFERSVFVSADETLREVLEWKESPYLWQLRHQKNGGKAIIDTQDLSKWEVDSFGMIAENYFKDSPSTFHIASHGLVDSDGTSAGLIKIGGQELNAAETAELIRQSMLVRTDKGDAPFDAIINVEHQEFVVVVHSCHSAEGEKNFASELSKELGKFLDNVTVVGAPDVVFCSLDENGQYQEYVTTKAEVQNLNPGKKAWKAYKNGLDTGLGQQDYHATVKAIQSQRR